MRKSRFTEAQIVGILQASAAGAKTSELLRRHGSCCTHSVAEFTVTYGCRLCIVASSAADALFPEPQFTNSMISPVPRSCGAR